MRRLGDNHLGAGHVLLGIARNEDGRALKLLAGMGVSAEILEDRIFERRARDAS